MSPRNAIARSSPRVWLHDVEVEVIALRAELADIEKTTAAAQQPGTVHGVRDLLPQRAPRRGRDRQALRQRTGRRRVPERPQPASGRHRTPCTGNRRGDDEREEGRPGEIARPQPRDPEVPSGGLTAVGAIVLLAGRAVPGFSGPLESQGQILAYALIFGYAQQLLTGLIDRRAVELSTGIQDKSTDKPAKTG